MEDKMSKHKCKCGSENFKAVSPDTYWFEIDVNADKFMTVKVTDKDVIGDIEALTHDIVCDKCGEKLNAHYESYEWEWDC